MAQQSKSRTGSKKGKPDQSFDLKGFLPYQLAVLADSVSQSIAQLYREKFDLSRAEWRILAALGDHPNMTGRQLSDYTTQDKMQVSRAVNAMLERELLVKSENPDDLRHKVLSLSLKGQTLLDEVIPLVQERERALLKALTKEEQDIFLRAAEKLKCQAERSQSG